MSTLIGTYCTAMNRRAIAEESISDAEDLYRLAIPQSRMDFLQEQHGSLEPGDGSISDSRKLLEKVLMKLLYCNGCGDLVRLFSETRSCNCGKSYGRYLDDNATTVQTANSLSVGIANDDFRRSGQMVANGYAGFHPEIMIRAWFNPVTETDVVFVEEGSDISLLKAVDLKNATEVAAEKVQAIKNTQQESNADARSATMRRLLPASFTAIRSVYVPNQELTEEGGTNGPLPGAPQAAGNAPHSAPRIEKTQLARTPLSRFPRKSREFL